MRKTKKSRMTLLLSLMIIALMTGCANNESRIKLQKLVDDLDNHCPIKYDIATCVGARIIDDEMVVNYVYDENFINLDVLEQRPDFTKRFGSMLFNESGSEELFKLLIASGCGYKVIYKGSITKKETVIHFSNEDIIEIRKHPQSVSDLLDWQIEITKSMLPKQFDELGDFVSLEQDSISVSFIYSINEEKVSMKQLQAAKDEVATELKTELKEELTSPKSTSKPLLMLVIKAGKNLRYVYKGNKTGKTVSIDISNQELKEIASIY